MSNKPTAASWTKIQGFGGQVANVETAFSEGVGGAYFEPGIHKDVYIESLELRESKKGNSYLNLTIKNDEGAQIWQRVMLSKTDGPGFHFQYQLLGKAICSNGELLMRTFGNYFPANPQMLDGLRGMRLTIKVEKGKEGFEIQKNALGDNIIIDVETGAEYPELAGQTFDGYKDAKEAAKELGIQGCYNEVKRVSPPSPEYIEKNEAALSEILRSAETNSGPKAPSASRSQRPARTI